MRFTWAYNAKDTDTRVEHMGWSVVLVQNEGLASYHINVVLHGQGPELSELKAKTIAMILNAEEPY